MVKLLNIKKIIKKIGGNKIQNVFTSMLIKTGLNNKYILFTSKKAIPNRVNLNYCHDFKNLGDNISPVIVNYMLKKYKIDGKKNIGQTKHLYAVGSIITAGAQDCTVWGSGLLNTTILNRLNNRTIDFRCVRGPITRAILQDRGFSVPAKFGDPAIVFPLIFNPKVEKKYPVSIITHTNEKTDIPDGDYHIINVVTDDYKKFITEVKQSELIISSSLHGIIFAEIYGIKAIMLRPQTDMLKYYDYYYSTERFEFPIAKNVSEALKIKPAEIPDFNKLQKNLIETFPIDLWN